MDLNRLLNSIGKKVFVDYFEMFSNKNLSNDEKVSLLPQHYSISGSRTRVSCANRIFDAGLEKEALKIIINSRSEERAIEQAKALLSKLNND